MSTTQFPITRAIGTFYIGTIDGKLKGIMQATKSSGTRSSRRITPLLTITVTPGITEIGGRKKGVAMIDRFDSVRFRKGVRGTIKT